ncbi:ATP-binding protein [Candidatus Omnitrophota bacterium]
MEQKDGLFDSYTEVKEKFKLIIKVRFVAGLVMLVAFGLLRLFDLLDFPFLLFAIAPLFEMFINQPYKAVLEKVKKPSEIFLLNQVLDIIAITWGLHFVGGIDILVAPIVYVLVFVFTALMLTPFRTYLIANFAFVAYFALMEVERHGIVPDAMPAKVIVPASMWLIYMFIVFVTYNLIAFFLSFLSNALRKKEKDLAERVKELNCFYNLSRLTEKHRDSAEGIMREMVEYLPFSWKYPEVAAARICINGECYQTLNFIESEWRQAADLKVHGKKVGEVEVCYLKEMPEADEGPFIVEERILIDSIAERLGEIAERIHAENSLEEYSEKLKRSNKDLSDFTYIVSHDLKEPLRNIDAFSRFLQEDCKKGEYDKGHENIDRIRANVSRMQGLIDNLLELSRLDRKENPFEMIRSRDLVQEGIARCEYAMETSNAKVEIKGKLPEIYCDRLRVSEVFANLISNAIKFKGKENPHIEVGCKEDGDFYEFYVKDNGCGMDKKDFDRIFEIFIRLGTKEDSRGTGIGLTIVKKIIEMHHGKVWLESAPGKGTTFYFTIPMKK